MCLESTSTKGVGLIEYGTVKAKLNFCISTEISNIMSTSLDPLRTTAPDLHRFCVYVCTTKQWYDIMAEARAWFGKNWKCQGKVRRKLENICHGSSLPVWFDVPDPRWSTWVSTKLGVRVVVNVNK